MDRFDVIVIGSGYGGAIPAMRLAAAGRKVLMLERGPKKTSADFELSYSPQSMLPLYGVAYNADLSMLFRYGQLLGGSSVVNSGMMPRAPTETFEYVDPRDGKPVWPKEVTRAVLNPYYEMAEQMLGVRRVTWDEVPANGAAFAHLLATAGHTADRAPFNFVGCLQTGFCEVGRKFDRKITMLHSYIPQAEKDGCEVRTLCEVRSLRKTDYGYAVRYVNAGNTIEVEAPVVVLGAGAIHTPAILLRSKDNLPGISDAAGKYFNNNGDIAFGYQLPEDFPIEFTQFKGRTNATLISYSFWKTHRISLHTGCTPPGIFAGLDLHAEGEHAWGLAAKKRAREIYLHRVLGIVVDGLCPSVGAIRLLPNGEPLVHFNPDDLSDYVAKAMMPMYEIAEANRATVLKSTLTGFDLGGAHPMGSARMADTPERGTCDAFGRVFGVPGVYVADASTFSGSTGVNPAITVAANAERIAAQIIQDTN